MSADPPLAQPITARTRLAALFGFPGTYSLSPQLHIAAYRQLGIDATYLVFPTEEAGLSAAVTAAKHLQFLGVSITIPHKESVLSLCDELSEEAKILGAVNTLHFRDGRVIGHNTDGEGFIRALIDETGFAVSGKRIALIGAGGVAKAVAAALGRHGAADIAVVNRSQERAEQTAEVASVARVGSLDDVTTADVVVNATPVGMSGVSEGESPLPADLFQPNQVVVDLIYKPAETQLLIDARTRGAQTANGLGMLVHQASLQIELWTGQAPDVHIMRSAV